MGEHPLDFAVDNWGFLSRFGPAGQVATTAATELELASKGVSGVVGGLGAAVGQGLEEALGPGNRPKGTAARDAALMAEMVPMFSAATAPARAASIAGALRNSRQQGGCVSEIDGISNRRSKHYGKFQGPRNRAAIIAVVAGVRRPPIGCRRRSVPKSDHRRGYQVELPGSCITSGGRRGARRYVTGSACGKGRGPAGSGPADYRIGNADRVGGQPRGRREN